MNASPPRSVSLHQVSSVLQERPLNPSTCAAVLLSSLTKAFLCGFSPQWLPVYVCLQFPPLLLVVFGDFRRRRSLLYFLELCWVVNCVGYCVVAHEILVTCSALPFEFAPLLTEQTRAGLGLAFFIIANGPLAASVIMNSNMLIMHDLVRSSAFFIHFTPAAISWLFRWRQTVFLNQSWAPFDANSGFFAMTRTMRLKVPPPPIPFLELMRRPVIVYAAWFVPYAVWLLFTGYSWPARYKFQSSYNDLARNMPKYWPPRVRALAYLFMHAFANMFAFGCAAFLFRSLLLHTLWIFVLLAVASHNAASYYSFTYGGKRAIKRLEKISKEGEEKAEIGLWHLDKSKGV